MRIIGRQTFLSIFYGHGMSFFWLFQTIFSLYIYRGVERGNLVSERHSDKLKPGNRARSDFHPLDPRQYLRRKLSMKTRDLAASFVANAAILMSQISNWYLGYSTTCKSVAIVVILTPESVRRRISEKKEIQWSRKRRVAKGAIFQCHQTLNDNGACDSNVWMKLKFELTV